MADSMEVTILAIVCPAIRCEWNLATWQEATITTVGACAILCAKSISYDVERFILYF